MAFYVYTIHKCYQCLKSYKIVLTCEGLLKMPNLIKSLIMIIIEFNCIGNLFCLNAVVSYN